MSVSAVREDASRKMPFYVRWRVNGVQHWRSFATREGPEGADQFHANLVSALNTGSSWDAGTGLPTAFHRRDEAPVGELAQQFIVTEWVRLSPNTRRSYAESMVAFTFAAVKSEVTGEEPEGARQEFSNWLRPSGTNRRGSPVWPGWADLEPSTRSWLELNGLRAGELDSATVKRINHVMRRRPGGGIPYAMTTQNRLVNPARRMLRDAAELGLIEQVPWPDAKRGAKAKSEMGPRPRRAEAYPSLDRLRGIIRAMGNDQPASVGYQALSALCLYAGLRPGEAVALRVEDFENIDATFTHVEITRAWHGVAGDKWNSPDERISKPKTERSVRSVLVPRPAMSYVQRWCRRSGITEGRIFVTRTGGRPKQSNWTRALANACEKAGWPTPLTPYDLRRVHASELVRWVSITEAAERLGHSVDVLTKNYLRPIEEDRPEGVLVGWDAFLDLIDMHYEERLWEGGEAQAVSVEGEAW